MKDQLVYQPVYIVKRKYLRSSLCYSIDVLGDTEALKQWKADRIKFDDACRQRLLNDPGSARNRAIKAFNDAAAVDGWEVRMPAGIRYIPEPKPTVFQRLSSWLSTFWKSANF